MLRCVGNIESWSCFELAGDYFYYTIKNSSVINICNRFTFKHISLVKLHRYDVVALVRSNLKDNGDILFGLLSIDSVGMVVVWESLLKFIRSFRISNFTYSTNNMFISHDSCLYYVSAKKCIIVRYNLYGKLICTID